MKKNKIESQNINVILVGIIAILLFGPLLLSEINSPEEFVIYENQCKNESYFEQVETKMILIENASDELNINCFEMGEERCLFGFNQDILILQKGLTREWLNENAEIHEGGKDYYECRLEQPLFSNALGWARKCVDRNIYWKLNNYTIEVRE